MKLCAENGGNLREAKLQLRISEKRIDSDDEKSKEK